jgi:hypothetical protein
MEKNIQFPGWGNFKNRTFRKSSDTKGCVTPYRRPPADDERLCGLEPRAALQFLEVFVQPRME